MPVSSAQWAAIIETSGKKPTSRSVSAKQAFTNMFHQRLAALLPNVEISVAGPLSLQIESPPSEDHPSQINLDRIWDFCQRNPDECEEACADFASSILASVSDDLALLDVSALMLAVRSEEYILSIREHIPGTAPVTGPLAGDIWWIILLDTANSARVVTQSDLDTLGLSQDQAFEIALKNVEPTLNSDPLEPPPENAVGAIDGDYYESSRMLFMQKWDELSAQLKGPLLIAVPAPETILFADGGNPRAAAALAKIAQEDADQHQFPLSTTVLRKTQDGWQAIP